MALKGAIYFNMNASVYLHRKENDLTYFVVSVQIDEEKGIGSYEGLYPTGKAFGRTAWRGNISYARRRYNTWEMSGSRIA